MTIECEVDEAARRVVMASVGDVPGAQVSRFIAELVRRRPELAEWDWVHDVRANTGAVDNADIQTVAEAFAHAAPGPCYTVFVSEDRNLALWSQVMDHAFRGRKHLTALTVEAAIEDIDRRRGRI